MPNSVWVVPLLHPAAILRGRFADEPAQVRYLKRALAIASGQVVPPAHDVLLEGALLDPTLDELVTWFRGLYAHTDRSVAVDIECAGPHLVCVGLCPLTLEYGPIVVHFRRARGEPAWHDLETTETVVAYLAGVLADPLVPKWFHNGQAFDIPYLTQVVGFEVNGYVGDTMLLQRYLAAESPADLQHLAIHYAGFPAWKHLKNEEQPDDK